MNATANAIFAARQLAGLFVTLLVSSIVIFAGLALAPGDPAAAMVGGTTPSPETVQALREHYHLDAPFWQRYWDWITSLLGGDLGQSFVYKTDIGTLVAPRIETTLLLVVFAAVLILILGVGSGLLAALGSRGLDRSISVINAGLMGVPTFVVAIVLVLIFSQALDWFPVYGTGEGLTDQLRHLTLPAVSMAVAYLAFVSRVTRTSVRAQLHSEHVETARSRGIAEHVVLRKHVIRNASGEIFTASGVTIAGLIAATAVAERAFGVNGIGSLLVDAASRKDIPMVQVISLFIVAAFVVVNTTVDVLNRIIDPRIGQGRRS